MEALARDVSHYHVDGQFLLPTLKMVKAMSCALGAQMFAMLYLIVMQYVDVAEIGDNVKCANFEALNYPRDGKSFKGSG